MPVEETMWDVRVSRDIDRYDTERLRAELANVVRKQLSPGKRLLRVVTWCPNGGALFRPKIDARRFAVAYEVALSV
ncbi:hypothetical protein [Mycobacterium talmoniae]|uniref:Uncharacterized protein n=2 Tax=Mycobacterium talmoniae TaxID=1858794 RepID=A0A2S8BJ61_9MYCO|nr:hypothetical protein [Mycobacterium talmoniae]PQM46722.1 hypothetical protein C1Y40_03099 [Mycobacterium talmoniae]